ncbi:MAG: hypothetical protein E7543_06040 [Ruminococcaceae bacterium]|nr:hypothetical protein [Oscillospiraceae bacterium]MBQ9913820.1 hypothetical protein [Clostridia bacterium]
MDKNNLLVRKTIIIVVTVAILFTSGFVLGALSAEIKELAPAVEQVTESTTESTTVTTTQAPTTLPPTTAAPTTEAPTEPSTEAPSESDTTEAATEETTDAATEEEPCCLVQIALTILELCKTVIDAVISFLSSL